jgi:hypothetical protein
MISRGYILHEVRYGNIYREREAFNIQEDGFEAYLEFSLLHEALAMDDELEIDGHVVRLWHKGV